MQTYICFLSMLLAKKEKKKTLLFVICSVAEFQYVCLYVSVGQWPALMLAIVMETTAAPKQRWWWKMSKSRADWSSHFPQGRSHFLWELIDAQPEANLFLSASFSLFLLPFLRLFLILPSQLCCMEEVDLFSGPVFTIRFSQSQKGSSHFCTLSSSAFIHGTVDAALTCNGAKPPHPKNGAFSFVWKTAAVEKHQASVVKWFLPKT